MQKGGVRAIPEELKSQGSEAAGGQTKEGVGGALYFTSPLGSRASRLTGAKGAWETSSAMVRVRDDRCLPGLGVQAMRAG